MIEVETRDMRAVILQLTAKAAALGRARAEIARRSAAADDTRWRRARLLWPLFTKD